MHGLCQLLARLKFDIGILVDRILDHIPQDRLIHGRVLDPAMGGGQFLKAVEQRKRAAGLGDHEIRDSVHGWENNVIRVNYAVNRHGLAGTCSVRSFLDGGDNMRFDVIVGNPPYQRDDSAAKRWTLWDRFANEALDRADLVAMVVPQSLMSPGKIWDRVKASCKVLETDVSKHFNVGSTFCYFISDVQHSGSTRVISLGCEKEIAVDTLPFLPPKVTDHTLALLDRLLSRPRRDWHRGELHTSNKRLFSDSGRYTVMHTNAQTLRTDVQHANLHRIRVGVTLSGYPRFQAVRDAYMSQACMWTEFPDHATAEAFAAECNGPEIQEMLSTFKWSGWNSKQVIELL